MFLLFKIATGFVSLIFAVVCVMTADKRIARVRRQAVGIFTSCGIGAIILVSRELLGIHPRSIVGLGSVVISIVLVLKALRMTPKVLRSINGPSTEEDHDD